MYQNIYNGYYSFIKYPNLSYDPGGNAFMNDIDDMIVYRFLTNQDPMTFEHEEVSQIGVLVEPRLGRF